MRVILYCFLFKCLFGVGFTTSEGLSINDDVQFETAEVGNVDEVDSPHEVQMISEAVDNLNLEYDVDLINSALETLNMSIDSIEMKKFTLNEETEQFIKELLNETKEETHEMTESKPIEEETHEVTESMPEEESSLVKPTPKKKRGRKPKKAPAVKPRYNLRKYGCKDEKIGEVVPPNVTTNQTLNAVDIEVRRIKSKSRSPPLKGNWKKTCCSYGKKVGNSESIYKAENLFEECGEKTRNLSSSRITRQCKLIFMNCCENKALRRYYGEQKLNSTKKNSINEE